MRCALAGAMGWRGSVLLLAASGILVLAAGQARGAPLTPIARWDVVPWQRIEHGATLNCGVVAFSKAGIERVTFSVAGERRDVTEMTHNDQSGVHEYWTPVAAGDFDRDGPVTVRATVHGADGGVRELKALPLVVNPTGSLPRPEAWADAENGSDETGRVNDPARPFKTIGRAMAAIRVWMRENGYGDHIGGGIVRLTPGHHPMSNGRVWNEIPAGDEWFTITRSADGTRQNTIIDSFEGSPVTRLLKIDGITLEARREERYVVRSPSKYADYVRIWINDCRLLGFDRHVNGCHPVQFCSYITGCSVHNTHNVIPAKAVLARGLTADHIGNDLNANCPMMVNCEATDIDPGLTYAHADAWQFWHTDGPNNTIVYNCRVMDAHYQGIMCRTGRADSPPARDVAFVNFFIELSPPLRPAFESAGPNNGHSLWMRSTDHLLLWHCSFIGQSFSIFDDGDQSTGERLITNITNLSVKGCYFGAFKQDDRRGGRADFSDFESNHYVTPAGGVYTKTPGTGVTTGDARLDNRGCPTPSSPLVDRLAHRLVPTDAWGRARDARADVGACELQRAQTRP